jgi:O-antigen ligase
MRPWTRLVPFAVFLFILPFPGTVTLRLIALAAGLAVCAWTWHGQGLPQVPAKYELLLWGGCAFLSLATAIDPAYSLGEIKSEIGYAMAAYLGFLTLTRRLNDARFFVAALMLGNLALALLALREHLSSDAALWNERGLAGGSGAYSTYLLALLPVSLWAGSLLQHRQRWPMLIGFAGLQLAVAVLAGQRAFWLVFALQTLCALYLLRARGFIDISAPRLRATGVVAVVLCTLAILAATATRNTVTMTEDPRLATWPAVAARILEHPLAGKGFGREIMKKAYPDLLSQEYPAVWHAHNLFLNYGMAMGIPGMIAILLLFFALLRKFWNLSRAHDRILSMAGICGVLLVIGVVARNLTNDFFQRDLALLYWSIAGMLLGYAQHAKHAPCAPAAESAVR